MAGRASGRRARRGSVGDPPCARHGGDIVDSVTERLTLLTVHAHPDDEASKGAPTVARYHAEGVHTVLVCCTGGEEGDLQNPSLREPGQPFHGLTPEEEKAKVAELRPAELAASARIIGFDEVVMLGYRDSGMPDTPANEHPDSFHQADIDEAAGRLVAVIRRVRPQVCSPTATTSAVYPHPDHLKVHDISVLAFDRAGDPDWYPELGEPFQPSKLYYVGVVARPDGWRSTRRCSQRDGTSPFDEKWFERPDRTTASRPRSTSPTSSGPARQPCGPTPPRSTRPRRGGSASTTPSWPSIYPWEDWILARSLVGPIPTDGSERDLFAGVRTEVASERYDARSSTGWSSARRTRSSTGPTTPTWWSPCRSPRCGRRFDPTVAFMQGKLKSTGPTGPLFELLRSGEAAVHLTRLAARP